MKQPSHESLFHPALRTRGERSCVIDASNPVARGSVARRANTAWSSEHHLKTAGISALIAAERISVRAISVLVAAFFLIVGASKLSDPSGITGGLSRWSNPTLVYLLARAVEISGAVLLLIPRWASLGAVGLAAMMAGSVVSRLAHNESSGVIVPAVLLALLGLIAYAGRPRQG